MSHIFLRVLPSEYSRACVLWFLKIMLDTIFTYIANTAKRIREVHWTGCFIFFMYRRRILCLIWRCWFLNCSVQRPVWIRGGGHRAGRLSFIMHLSGPSRAIKFLYAPAPPPPTVWALKPPSWALHLLGLSLANICVCTHIMLVCTHRPLQGGLLYIKPPMHLWFLRPRA